MNKQTIELEEKVRELQRSVDEMRGRLARLDGETGKEAPKRRSRRGFMTLGAGALVGALGWAASKPTPASAANGATVATGATVTGETPTVIQGDGVAPAPTPVFAAASTNFSQTALTTAGGFAGALQGLGTTTGAVEGVDGWAQGAQAFGVYGLTDSGTGVVGESNVGIGLYARRSGRIRQDGLVAAGVPGYTPNDFEQVRDANGTLWISVAGGAWKQVATTALNLFPDPRRIYDGYVQPTAPGTYGPIDATQKMTTTGGLGGPSGVPAGAQAAYCAVQSYNAGVMTLFPDLAPDPGIANWASTTNGPLNLLYVFVPLSAAGKFKIHTYFTGQKFIDVWGYLM